MYSINPAFAVYTCGGQNGSIPVKTSQGDGFYEKNSCMVIEMEGVIDGERQVVVPSLLLSDSDSLVTL
jgi:hypothetical protein